MQLAQLNIARMIEPLGHPVMKDFEDNLDRVNDLAEKSKGFVWRFQEDNNNATSVTIFDDDYWLINLSVWETTEDLFSFAYNSDHMEIFRRRREWFEVAKEMTMVLWYVEDSQIPSVEEAIDRLLHLRKHGDTPYAFSFRKRYTPDELLHWTQTEHKK